MTKSEFRDLNERIAARLRCLAGTATTAAVRARIIEKAEEHERIALHGNDELDDDPSAEPS